MSITQITPEQAKQWLDNEEALLIDVREPAEHRHTAGRILWHHGCH